MLSVLVTGASGYIGSRLTRRLVDAGFSVVAAVRSVSNVAFPIIGVRYVSVGDINSKTEWSLCLRGVSIVFHLAGRAHVVGGKAEGDDLHRETNFLGTLNLAQQAAKEGVDRFIFLSTVGVLGQSSGHTVFDNATAPQPVGAYAKSKWNAERALRELSSNSELKVLSVRPPVVYGPSAPGNFGKLVKLVRLTPMLPLGSFNSIKSMIACDNLNEFLVHVATLNRFYEGEVVVSDNSDWTIAELVGLISNITGTKCFNLPLPPDVVVHCGRLVFADEELRKLWMPTKVDASKTFELMNWTPVFAPARQLDTAVRSFC